MWVGGHGMMGRCDGCHPICVPNISTLVFVENIRHMMCDFQGGFVSGRVWVGKDGPDPKKQMFSTK